MFKKNIIGIVSFLVIGLLIYFIIDKTYKIQASDWILVNLNFLKLTYEENKILTMLLFCAAHLATSTISLPGGCTLLNTLSGAIFGFWQGCLIVYCITIVGAGFGYLLGRSLPLHYIRVKYEKKINYLRIHLSESNFLLLIILRLSPLLPFGVINIILGFLGIPIGTYFITTFIGVFFDVVLLNSIGAMISGVSDFNALDKWKISLVFLSLMLFYCAKMLQSKFKNDCKEELKD